MGEKEWHNISKEEEDRIADLFNRLDVNKDGKIDINDLTLALQQMEIPQVPGQAQTLLDKYDRDKDGSIDFSDFIHYIVEHEKGLKLSFAMVDHNQDGFITSEEIMTALKKLGVEIDTIEAEKLLKRMDKDLTLRINWYEWREYLLLHPSSDMWDIVHYWRHASVIDVGEDFLVPDELDDRPGAWWRHLVAGGIAGAVSRTCTAPLDRLKVILQVSGTPGVPVPEVHGTRHSNLGIQTGFRYMLEEGGYKSLWRGNGINCLKIVPESAIKFAAYEQLKRAIKGDSDRELKIYERFAAGSMAGVISQSTIYPMEVLKTRLALRKTAQYDGILDCANKIYKFEGLRSFYRGYLPNVMGIIPYAGIDLAIYETLKRFYMSKHAEDHKKPGVMVTLACGTVSSMCGQVTSYPLALVRTKLQAKVTLTEADTMFGLFKTILESEGPRGLYRGLTPNFMKVIPAVGISYVVYEHVQSLLGVSMS